MAKVELKNVTKKFGGVTAVDNLSLTVEDKEFMCILGPSGCGKTTTLRMTAGLETPTSGLIYIGDEVVNDMTASERDIAMVFQFYALYPGMTVYENLAFPLKAQKLSKAEINRIVKETAERLNISQILQRKPHQITAGQAQRVALGRAVVRKPRVYLLDEPLTNLDARLRAQMRVELKRLQREWEQTTIYVTHDQLEAIAMADRIVIMDRGVLQQCDTPEGVYDRPTNRFVAGFVGSPPMNFVDASLVEADGRLLADCGPFKTDLSQFKSIMGERRSGEIVLGVRPEDIRITKTGIESDSFPVEVEAVEPIGDETIYDVAAEEIRLRAVTGMRLGIQAGEEAWLTLDKNKLHVFDRGTEKTLV